MRKIKEYDYKIIVLQKDDFETIDAIKEFKNINILKQKYNGYGNALIEGINAVNTDYCCIINADGSMDPKYLLICWENVLKKI